MIIQFHRIFLPVASLIFSSSIVKVGFCFISFIRALYSGELGTLAFFRVVLDILNKKGAETDIEDRRMFAQRAFGVSSHYDTAINAWFTKTM